jgi:hypothetical protein
MSQQQTQYQPRHPPQLSLQRRSAGNDNDDTPKTSRPALSLSPQSPAHPSAAPPSRESVAAARRERKRVGQKALRDADRALSKIFVLAPDVRAAVEQRRATGRATSAAHQRILTRYGRLENAKRGLGFDARRVGAFTQLTWYKNEHARVKRQLDAVRERLRSLRLALGDGDGVGGGSADAAAAAASEGAGPESAASSRGMSAAETAALQKELAELAAHEAQLREQLATARHFATRRLDYMRLIAKAEGALPPDAAKDAELAARVDATIVELERRGWQLREIGEKALKKQGRSPPAPVAVDLAAAWGAAATRIAQEAEALDSDGGQSWLHEHSVLKAVSGGVPSTCRGVVDSAFGDLFIAQHA